MRAATKGRDAFGVSAPELLRISTHGEAARLDRHLAQIQASGLRFVRVNISWSDYDGFAQNGFFPWRDVDGFVTALANRGLRMLPVPRGAPPRFRASNPLQCPDRDRSAIHPSGFAAYGEFVRAIVDRYGRNGSFWGYYNTLPFHPILGIEIWNEPNWAPFWCPTPDPEAFAGLAVAGASAAKAEDPQLEVIVGGVAAFLTPSVDAGGAVKGMPAGEFLGRMVAARPELKDLFGAVGIHVYGSDAANSVEIVRRMREAVDASGFQAADISVTEFGYNRLQMSAAAVAQHYRGFVDAIGRNGDCEVTSIAPHAWFTEELNPFDPEHWWGIAHPLTGEPYGAAVAYAQTINTVVDPAAEPTEICAAHDATAGEKNPVKRLRLSGAKRKGKTSDRTPTFRFQLAPGLRAKCAIDKAKLRPCRSPHRAKRLSLGRHRLTVQAFDEAKVAVGEPERLRFRIVRAR